METEFVRTMRRRYGLSGFHAVSRSALPCWISSEDIIQDQAVSRLLGLKRFRSQIAMDHKRHFNAAHRKAKGSDCILTQPKFYVEYRQTAFKGFVRDLDKAERMRLMREAINLLDNRDQYVLRLHFAYCNLKEIAKKVGVSESRACQLMQKIRERVTTLVIKLIRFKRVGGREAYA